MDDAGHIPPAQEATSGIRRRGLLASLTALGAAALAKLSAPGAASAANGDPLILGVTTNEATNPTGLTGDLTVTNLTTRNRLLAQGSVSGTEPPAVVEPYSIMGSANTAPPEALRVTGTMVDAGGFNGGRAGHAIAATGGNGRFGTGSNIRSIEGGIGVVAAGGVGFATGNPVSGAAPAPTPGGAGVVATGGNGFAGGMAGVGVSGVSSNNSGVYGSSATYVGVYGRCPSGAGVVGNSDSNYGVYGLSGSNLGVIGQSASSIGVYGISNSNFGVSGYSTNSYAVAGNSANNVAVYGTSSTSVGVLGNSGSNIGVYGVSNSGTGVYGQSTSGNAGVFAGAVVVQGDFTVVGGAKSAAVPHPDGSLRRLYAVEAPESWFEDFGEGQLAGGRTDVRLDRDFAAVVRSDAYHVFLTPRGDCNGLYVSGQNPTGFEVRELKGGTSSLSFSYRVVARRKDIAGPRLDRVRVPPHDARVPAAPQPVTVQAPALPTGVPTPPEPPAGPPSPGRSGR